MNIHYGVRCMLVNYFPQSHSNENQLLIHYVTVVMLFLIHYCCAILSSMYKCLVFSSLSRMKNALGVVLVLGSAKNIGDF